VFIFQRTHYLTALVFTCLQYITKQVDIEWNPLLLRSFARIEGTISSYDSLQKGKKSNNGGKQHNLQAKCLCKGSITWRISARAKIRAEVRLLNRELTEVKRDFISGGEFLASRIFRAREGRVAPRAQQVAAALPVCCWAIVVSTASLNVNFANNSFRLICSERRPQIKRSRRLSFICSWIHLFPQGSTGQPTKSIWIEKRDWSWILAVQKQLTNSVFTQKIL